MEDLNRQYRKNENIVFRKINDEAVLVPIKDNVGDMGFIYNLNEVGAFVWEHLDGKNQLLDIKRMMLEEFEVSFQEAEEDLCDFVEQLREINAIVQVTHNEAHRNSEF